MVDAPWKGARPKTRARPLLCATKDLTAMREDIAH
jgi:hypothetical protein